MSKLKIVVPALFVVLGLSYYSYPSGNQTRPLEYKKNPQLKTIYRKPGWKGTPVTSDGKFQNLHLPFSSNTWDLLKWQLSANPQREEKKLDTQRLQVHFSEDLFQDQRDAIVWLGHASFLIRVNGITFLTDPVFFESAFLKRHAPLPFPIEKINQVDYLLISHDHRDHCDEKTLRHIYQKNQKLKVLTGLNMAPLLQKWMPGVEIQEAGWYQQFQTEAAVSINFVPTRHWSRRGLLDENERLWGGFFLKNEHTSIYFMGDSGYGEHFEEIRDICGETDYALLGVGAYKPEWFMHPVHMNPLDALKVFQTLEAKHFIPMHYGTFDLSDEPLLEPLRMLEEQSPEGFLPLNVGQIHLLP